VLLPALFPGNEELDPDPPQAYIMLPGTPYEHLMLPVHSQEHAAK
jgi:hypothetical protein